MGEYNTYKACHGGEELAMGYTTYKCVSRIHVSMQGWLHDGERLHVCIYNFKYNKVMQIILNHIRLQLLLSTNSQ